MGSVGKPTKSNSFWDDGVSYREFNTEPAFNDIWYENVSTNESESNTYIWFANNTNMKDLIEKIVKDGKADYFREWAEGSFMDGQQYHGFSNMTTWEQFATRTYDKYLDQAELNSPVTVVRNAGFELLGVNPASSTVLTDLKDLKGSLVESKGNMACAAAKYGLNIGSQQPVQYNFHLQGGPKCKGAGMYIGDSDINHWDGAQREFLMNRNTFFEVGNAKYDDTRGVYVVDMYYRGRREKHDYR